jgi:hypothetical protein
MSSRVGSQALDVALIMGPGCYRRQPAQWLQQGTVQDFIPESLELGSHLAPRLQATFDPASEPSDILQKSTNDCAEQTLLEGL